MGALTKLYHAKIGDRVKIASLGHPTGEIYRVIVWTGERTRGSAGGNPQYQPGGCGLYGEPRMLRLLHAESSTHRKMPHLSVRVQILRNDESKERRHAANSGSGAELFVTGLPDLGAVLTSEKLKAASCMLRAGREVNHEVNHEVNQEKSMLKNIKSSHLTYGGTGIANFGTSSDTERDRLLPIYLEAIKRHGDDNYVVSMHPTAESFGHNGYSLHYLGARMIDHSPFWRIFDQVHKEFDTEVQTTKIGDKTFKITRTGDTYVVETNADYAKVHVRTEVRDVAR